MNIIVFGGFLGSGKTSILHLMSEEIVGTKQKLAIIENEICQNGVDNEFLKRKGYFVKELFKGCICCTLSSDMILSIREIITTEKPDWIIVEATGLARPDEITKLIKKHFANMSVKTCVVVDANRWLKLIKVAGSLVHEQIQYADYVLLNKIDLVSDEHLELVVQDLNTKNSQAEFFHVSAVKKESSCKETCQFIMNSMDNNKIV